MSLKPFVIANIVISCFLSQAFANDSLTSSCELKGSIQKVYGDNEAVLAHLAAQIASIKSLELYNSRTAIEYLGEGATPNSVTYVKSEAKIKFAFDNSPTKEMITQQSLVAVDENDQVITKMDRLEKGAGLITTNILQVGNGQTYSLIITETMSGNGSIRYRDMKIEASQGRNAVVSYLKCSGTKFTYEH